MCARVNLVACDLIMWYYVERLTIKKGNKKRTQILVEASSLYQKPLRKYQFSSALFIVFFFKFFIHSLYHFNEMKSIGGCEFL